jgi:hypothetical protein
MTTMNKHIAKGKHNKDDMMKTTTKKYGEEKNTTDGKHIEE